MKSVSSRAADSACAKPDQQERWRKRSTETAAQRQRILEALRLSPKTTDQLRALGCYQVSARIFELRKRGYRIETALYDAVSADGYFHKRMARYFLESEPGECE